MALTKSLGHDGVAALFYQKYWDRVGVRVTEAFLNCLNGGESMEKINGTLICLIPKKIAANLVSNFCPIRLCNVIYKIVSKVLVNRLQVVLGEFISEAQSAFVLGRQITNNAMIGFECLHALRTKKQKRGSLALKLDMSKAYDRVEWDFVLRVMRRLGFPERWITQVMGCVKNVTFSFLINRSVRESIVGMSIVRVQYRFSIIIPNANLYEKYHPDDYPP
ncbi:hypothetical protein Dsin_013007 [Dipteronia sinensis]|uniref:Reverse transcriptase domain-containing protein n=1 Tax=Dipteronia sinensis TaxID=43782 RepID=A0AAE0E906_9ROSI|nr:hypothetical protein Dsin_013007 [Dipteronia sinensis]